MKCYWMRPMILLSFTKTSQRSLKAAAGEDICAQFMLAVRQEWSRLYEVHLCLCFKVKTFGTRAKQRARAVWIWKTKADSSYTLSLCSLCCRFQEGRSQSDDVIGSGAPSWKGLFVGRESCFSCGSSLSRQHHEKHNTIIKKVFRLTPVRVFSVRIIRMDG